MITLPLGTAFNSKAYISKIHDWVPVTCVSNSARAIDHSECINMVPFSKGGHVA
jgi:hypothetical protein